MRSQIDTPQGSRDGVAYAELDEWRASFMVEG
jgi:hypothetical protein